MLCVKVMTLKFDEVRGGYDDAVLNDFLRKHRAVDVKHHFFVKSETQYLTLLITFHVTPQDLDRVEHAETKVRDSQESWKNLLQESDMGLFQLLRAWRGRRARNDGMPPYVVLTNRQLAFVTRSKPQSLADLQKIDGFGEAKTSKYGEDILAITRIETPASPADLIEMSGPSPYDK